MSMDVSNVDTESITHCTPKVELYIKGAFVDPTRHVRGGWIDLLVDCTGVLWMSNLVAIWRYSLPPLHLNVTVVGLMQLTRNVYRPRFDVAGTIRARCITMEKTHARPSSPPISLDARIP